MKLTDGTTAVHQPTHQHVRQLGFHSGYATYLLSPPAGQVRPAVTSQILGVPARTGSDRLQSVGADVAGKEGSYFYCNKINNWEEGQASTSVDRLRLT